MPERLTIRRARPDDAAAMVEVRRKAILSQSPGPYRQPTVDAWAAEAAANRAGRYAQDIADPDAIVLVAEAANEILGFAIAVPAMGELSTIYVKPNRIGRVGSALLLQLEELAWRTAESLTCVAALGAVPFYEANGFLDRGSVDYVDGSGAVVPCRQMKKMRTGSPARGLPVRD